MAAITSNFVEHCHLGDIANAAGVYPKATQAILPDLTCEKPDLLPSSLSSYIIALEFIVCHFLTLLPSVREDGVWRYIFLSDKVDSGEVAVILNVDESHRVVRSSSVYVVSMKSAQMNGQAELTDVTISALRWLEDASELSL